MDPQDAPPKRGRGRTIRFVVMILIGSFLAFAYVYMHYLIEKSPLGGPCRWAMQCQPEAPKCMRESLDGDGVCSRDCALGADCAPGIRCVKAEIDDDGATIAGGYCFPQSFLDARKARAAAAKRAAKP